MENKGIALKRHHKNRLKNKRKKDMVYSNHIPINKHVTTPTVCSGMCCGNPRNHFGNSKESKTIQELRADDNFNFDLDVDGNLYDKVVLENGELSIEKNGDLLSNHCDYVVKG